MNASATPDAFGTLIEPTTLKIQRLLPGPVERIWAYLTDSELRRKWLAAGAMEMKVGAPFEFVWRNSELTDPPGNRPDGFGDEHRMKSRITELDPPHKISFTWDNTGDVSFELEARGEKVLLTVTHRPAGTCISMFSLRGRPARSRSHSGTAGSACRRNTMHACRPDASRAHNRHQSKTGG
jgi:uncharacterized protein YndB with AHSA1/START domain